MAHLLYPAALGLRCPGFFLAAADGGCAPAAVLRLLTAVASFVVQHWLSGAQASAVAAPSL